MSETGQGNDAEIEDNTNWGRVYLYVILTFVATCLLMYAFTLWAA